MSETKIAQQFQSPFVSFLHRVKIEKIENFLKPKSEWKVVNSFDIVTPEKVGTGESRLYDIRIIESIDTPFIRGTVQVLDRNDWIGQMNLNGSERLTIEFAFIDNLDIVKMEFFVYGAKIINNFSNENSVRLMGNENVIIYELEFMSDEIFNNTFDKSVLEFDKDFVGLIAKGTGKERKDGNLEEIPGLVNQLATKLGLTPIEIEETKNGIWLKSGEISFPSTLPQGQINATALMNYLTQYAVSKKNVNAVNYFFWKDRDGWHFKSVESILEKNKEKPTVEFDLNTDDLLNKYRVLNISVVSQHNNLELFQNNAFMSHYVRIDPDYKNVYSDFLSSKAGFTYSIVDYNYHRDFSKVNHIETNKLISDNVETNPVKASRVGKNKTLKEIPIPATLSRDNVFSHYNTNTFNTPFQFNIHHSADFGFGSRPEEPAYIWWDYLDRENDSRWSNVAWQPQFDITELEISKLHKIYKYIRQPLEEKRKEFVRLKNLKRKWEVYRCVVCCSKTIPGGPEDIKILNDPKIIKDPEEYNFLFGEDGIFSENNQEYKIVAAGSFTDTIDYDSANEKIQHGLTLAVNLDKIQSNPQGFTLPAGVAGDDYKPNQWYSSTIGQFFNLKSNISNYIDTVLQRGINQYNYEIGQIDTKIANVRLFLDSVDSYITEANNWITSRLLPCCEQPENTTTPISGSSISSLVEFRNALLGNSGCSAPEPCCTCPDTCFFCASDGQWKCGGSSCEDGGGGGGSGGQCIESLGRRCKLFCNDVEEECLSVGCNYFGASGCEELLTFGSVYQTCDPATRVIVDEVVLPGEVGCSSSPDGWGACCVNCGDNQVDDEIPCKCIGNLSFSACEARGIALGDPNRATFFRERTCAQINNCGITFGGGYDLCQEGATACLRQGCTDPLTGSVFSREPASCIGFNYVDGLGNVPLITLPEGVCIKCNNFSTSALDVEFDDSNCCNCTLEQATTYSPLPEWASACSKQAFMKSIAQYIGTEGRWYNDYRFTPGGGAAFADIDDYIGPNGDPATVRRCLDQGDCYNTLCFNPLYLEVEKRRAEEELKILNAEKALLVYSRDIFQQNFIQKFQENYNKWWNRKAFFYSVMPGKNVFTDISTGITGSVIGGRTGPIQYSEKSLMNIKSIKRKSIRGSRYELLAKNKGITGAQVGEWLYEFFWENTNKQTQGNKHPYYSQKYQSPFVSQRQLFVNYLYNEDSNKLNNFPFASPYAPICTGNTYEYSEKAYLSIPEQQMQENGFVSQFTKIFRTQLDLNLTQLSPLQYQRSFDLYDIQLQSIPANLKKEQLSSYVRIEFNSPIGLDRIVDFPNGFIRDAGTEYFLPYLVSLTAGPTGRQTIRNNVVVIGMDPYGFDVAVKKSKVMDEETEKQYSWWNEYRNLNDTTLTNNGMDLWPEVGFETAYPYYAADPKGWWWDSAWYHGESDVKLLVGSDSNNYEWYTRSADVDPEYKESAHASGYLQYSYRKIKPHRSWWSFHIPKNIFIPQKLFHMLSTKFAKIDGESSGVLGDIFAYKYKDYYWWYGDEVDRWLRLSKEGKVFVESYGLKLLSVLSTEQNFENPLANHAFVHSDDSVNELHPGLQSYFNETTMHWMFGDFMVYKPNLVATDVWKYDLTGESTYGMVSPKTMSPNYDLFDDNFSAQFIVFSRQVDLCKQFTCANPEGEVSNIGCPEDNPLCNCPAQEHIPDEPEPTYLELYKAYKEIKECELIEEHLGKDYLGCVWSDPANPCSCNCPEIGKKFQEYLEYTRTYATFWDTPKNTPLIRKALISQLFSQTIMINVTGTSKVKIGDVVKIKQLNAVNVPLEIPEKNLHGYWMVTGVTIQFRKDSSQSLLLTLTRDTLPRSPDLTVQNLNSILDKFV